MSDLQKAWAKAKLSALEPFDEGAERRELEEAADSLGELPEPMDDDSSSASSASSTGTVIPSPSQRLFARPQAVDRSKNMGQIPWTAYFERELFLKDPSSSITHHAYLNSPSGKSPLFVFHHGAGSSGLSFAVVSSEIRKHVPSAGMLSADARGHGSTTDSSGADPDLSLDTLTADLLFVIRGAQERMHWAELPPLVLVGHSLGGAVVTNLAKQGLLGNAVLGFAVLDVVEGSAMDALQSMITYLSTRPAGFPTLEAGIDWHVRSRTVRNLVSARTSVPALLVEEGAGEGAGNGGAAVDRRRWKWRTDLAATQKFWEGWFVGLSKKFLEARGGKLLLLAGTDRLDTELTIGQMQGKYALQVFPEAGHFIHEDLPEKTAMMLVDFYRRNDRSQLVLPPKVSDLLRQGKKV
ncbi:hypothetical protein jhhlp_006539 [Lomentospora prolificans]|uniref:Protein phosphatase methylesterase 1 n=1 Tax=Lomentospora prolificans TaxID=41688 RepID=A0A2N3N662_9PEZI|nr:hypothetical protein jhhlp_006539 [Lomentospora prolificans]